MATPEDDWNVQDQYANIASQLFGVFVLRSIGYNNVELPKEYETGVEPLSCLYVVPSGDEASIFINRSTPPGGYWDEIVRSVMVGEAEMKFVRYFDFDVMGIRDLEYYLVRITSFDKHPHLIGRNALMRVSETMVFYKQTI